MNKEDNRNKTKEETQRQVYLDVFFLGESSNGKRSTVTRTYEKQSLIDQTQPAKKDEKGNPTGDENCDMLMAIEHQIKYYTRIEFSEVPAENVGRRQA